LKENSGSTMPPALVAMPASRKAEAKPKPCIKPKPNVSSRRDVGISLRKRFSTPTNTMETAINGSTIRLGICTRRNVATASVIECAMVNEVMIFSAAKKPRATSSRPKRKSK
jgi:hypothetical protein